MRFFERANGSAPRRRAEHAAPPPAARRPPLPLPSPPLRRRRRSPHRGRHVGHGDGVISGSKGSPSRAGSDVNPPERPSPEGARAAVAYRTDAKVTLPRPGALRASRAWLQGRGARVPRRVTLRGVAAGGCCGGWRRSGRRRHDSGGRRAGGAAAGHGAGEEAVSVLAAAARARGCGMRGGGRPRWSGLGRARRLCARE